MQSVVPAAPPPAAPPNGPRQMCMLGPAPSRPIIDCEGTTVCANSVNLDEEGKNKAMRWRVPNKYQKARKVENPKVSPPSNTNSVAKLDELEEEEDEETSENDN